MLYSPVSFYEVATSADIPDPMPEGAIFFVKTENLITINHGDIVGRYGTLLDGSVTLPAATTEQAGVTVYATDEEAQNATVTPKSVTPGSLQYLKDADTANSTAMVQAVAAEQAARVAADNALSEQISVTNSKLRYMPVKDFGTATPAQEDLTAWALGHTGLDAVGNGTVITNDFDNQQWVYSDEDTAWIPQGSAIVAPATNDSAGVVTGDATTDGGVNVDGVTNKMAVNGWLLLKQQIQQIANSIADYAANLLVPIQKGGTGATTLAGAKAALEIPDPITVATATALGGVKSSAVDGEVAIDPTLATGSVVGWDETKADITALQQAPVQAQIDLYIPDFSGYDAGLIGSQDLLRQCAQDAFIWAGPQVFIVAIRIGILGTADTGASAGGLAFASSSAGTSWANIAMPVTDGGIGPVTAITPKAIAYGDRIYIRFSATPTNKDATGIRIMLTTQAA